MSDTVQSPAALPGADAANSGTPRDGVSVRLRAARVGTAVLSLLVYLGAWESLIRLGGISSYLVPAPSEVLSR